MNEGDTLPALDESAVLYSREPTPGSTLVLLLHGLGGDEADIFSLAPRLPSAHIYAALRGPYAFEDGWAWTHREVRPDQPERIEASAAAVEAWLTAHDDLTCVGAVGFSQGAILALQLMRRCPRRLAWAVQLSGGPFPMDLPGDRELERLRPPVLWGHGGADPTLPDDAEQWVRQWMTTHTRLEEMLDPQLGHDVDDAMTDAVAAFIAARTA